jgi:SAM-dependent methyltransferase
VTDREETAAADIAAVQKPIWNRGAETYANAFAGNVNQGVAPTLDRAGVGAGIRVLDIATGPGILAAAAAERGATVKGVDFAKDMIAVARRTYPGITFEVADACKLPFDDASFEAVVMGFALFLMAEPDVVLREARRVLVPGGRACFSLWDWPVPGFDLFYGAMAKYFPQESIVGDPPLMGVSDRELLVGRLESADFAEVKIEPLPIIWELAEPEQLFDALATLRDFSPLSDEMLRAFRAEVARGARAYERDGRCFVPFPALLLWGTKP